MSVWSLANSIFDEAIFYFLAYFLGQVLFRFILSNFIYVKIVMFESQVTSLWKTEREILVPDKAGISLLKSCFSL